MFYLDLKDLLLTSLSLEKTLHLHKRFTIGKKCFTVIFHIRGRHLFIKKVKICNSKESIHSKHIRQRLFSLNIRQKAIRCAKKFTPNPMLWCSNKAALTLYNGPKSIDKETMTLAESGTGAGDWNITYSNIGMIDCGLQIMPQTSDYASDCRDIIWHVDKEQQTLIVNYCNVSTQTNSSLLSVAIQASCPMCSFPTQTIGYTKIASTQTDPIDATNGEIGDAFNRLLYALSQNQCTQNINLENCQKILEQLHALIELKSDDHMMAVNMQSEIIKKLMTDFWNEYSKQYFWRTRSSFRIHSHCKLMKKALKKKKTKKEEQPNT